jgi:hypothetical protein
MKTILAAFFLTTALLPVLSAEAQPQADFSGRWVTSATGGRGNPGSGWGSDLTITQDVGKLTVQYAFFGRGDMQPPLKFVYNLDGSEAKNIVMMGRGMQEQLSRTAWDGSKLVITTRHNIADPQGGADLNSETRQVLSLESPTVLLVETTRAGVMGGAATTSQTRYMKM